MTDSEKSLINESKKKQSSKKLKLIIFAVLLSTIPFIYSYFFKSKNSVQNKTQPELITVKKDSLKTSIESDGQIINPNIVNLSFFVNGTLETINVEEGGKVKKGDVLAQLDQRDFLFDLKTAQSSVEVNRANIRSKEAELTDLELKSLKKDLEVSQLDLSSEKADLEQKVEQSFDLGVLTLEAAFPEIEKALQASNEILAVEDNLWDQYSSTFNNRILENEAENIHKNIRSDFGILLQEYELDKQNSITKNRISVNLWKTATLAESLQNLLDKITELLKTARPNTTTTQTELDSAKSNIMSYNSKISSEQRSLISAKQSIETALLNQENNLKNSKNAIEKLQLKLDNEEQNYEKKEITKEANLAVQYAQLSQARIQVEKAQYNLGLTTLTAPISGEIIQINGNEGETIKTESTSSDNAFIKILSDANFTIEVYVEEVDIAKIKKEQKVYITLDAIEDLEMEGTVTFISSIATTESNGIVTYLVRIDITDTKGASIKEGMTAYTEFVTGEVQNVLVLPLSVLQKRGTKTMVFLEDKTLKEVKTGFSDGENIEILEGLSEGDKVWSADPSDETQNEERSAGNGRAGREISDEMIEQMKTAGFTAEEIEKMKAGEISDEMRTKMKALREASGGFGGRRP